MAQVSYREKVLRFREDAIVEAVNHLLASKGYDLMTVDEVAAEAGIAKASLYKHFTSKEELAGAAMVRVLDRAMAQANKLEAEGGASALDRITSMLLWTLQVQLAGEMPTLPAQNSKLVASLRANHAYIDALFALSDKLGSWITQAQAEGQLNPDLPPEMILYTLYARACDPVLGLLKASGNYADEQIIAWLVTTTLEGLGKRASAPATPAPRRVR